MEKIDKNMLKGVFIRRPLKNFIEDAEVPKLNDAQSEMGPPLSELKLTVRMASNIS